MTMLQKQLRLSQRLRLVTEIVWRVQFCTQHCGSMSSTRGTSKSGKSSSSSSSSISSSSNSSSCNSSSCNSLILNSYLSGRNSVISSSSSCSSCCNSNSSPIKNDAAEEMGRRVLDELIATEQNYLEDMSNGFERYTRIFNNEAELPAGLVNQKEVLLSYISQIITLHRHKFLPLMRQDRYQLELLFEKWHMLLERDCCYCYVLFAASQRFTKNLCETHEMYFKRLQITLDDPLGIMSFLMKPVQRLAGYPLLLSSLIKIFFKNRQLVSKRLIEVACRVESRLRELLFRVNQADQLNDIYNFDSFTMLNESRFITVGEFGLTDSQLRRNYKCKLFAFNTCFLYAERKKDKLLLRGRFTLPDVCFVPKSKSFLLCNKTRELEFLCDPALVQKWDRITKQVILAYGVADENAREASAREGVCRSSIWYIPL